MVSNCEPMKILLEFYLERKIFIKRATFLFVSFFFSRKKSKNNL
jgi:hypothetical protein